MLETLIFREIRYDENKEQSLLENKAKIEKNPEDIEALQNLAAIYHALKKNDKAIEIYEKLVKLKPDSHEIRAFLGYLYYENEQLDKAEENLNKALELSQMEPFIYFLLGNVFSRKGKISDAVDLYETAIFLDFDMYVAHIDFARKYENMGRHKKALREYRAAYEIDNRDEGLIEKIKYIENKCNTTNLCDLELDEEKHLITASDIVFSI